MAICAGASQISLAVKRSGMENNMNEKTYVDAVKSLTMPHDMAEELVENSLKSKHTGKLLFRYSRLAAAVIAILVLTAVGTTSHAAYQLYQAKNLDVFFASDVSREQIDAIGEEIALMEGVYSVRFVSADEAWSTFKNAFLTDELASEFKENPLKDSYSYRVTVRLDADAGEIIRQISQLEGVRHVTDLRNAK